MAEVNPGEKYLGFVCHKCGKPFPFIEETGETAGVSGAGHFEARCPRPKCGHLGRYQIDEWHSMTVHQKH